MSVTFVVMSVLVVALIFESYTSALFVSAAPYGSIECKRTGTLKVTCCQDHFEKTSSGIGFDIVRYCTECTVGEGGIEDPTDPRGHLRDCSPRYIEMSVAEQPPEPSLPTPPITGESILQEEGGVLEQPPSPPPSGPAAPLQGGVLEQLEQGDFAPGFTPGFLQQQEQLPPAEQGAAELPPPTTEETQPAAVEEELPVPVCQEGLEFNEDLGFCVPTECPDGQELNEETGVCVLEEEQPATAEQPEEQEQQTEEEQPSESGSEEENGNN